MVVMCYQRGYSNPASCNVDDFQRLAREFGEIWFDGKDWSKGSSVSLIKELEIMHDRKLRTYGNDTPEIPL